MPSPVQPRCTVLYSEHYSRVTICTADGTYITVLYKAAQTREEDCVAGTQRVTKRAYIRLEQQQQQGV